jgi:hypothetical protein
MATGRRWRPQTCILFQMAFAQMWKRNIIIQQAVREAKLVVYNGDSTVLSSLNVLIDFSQEGNLFKLMLFL